MLSLSENLEFTAAIIFAVTSSIEPDASINLYRLLKATMELNLAEKQIA